MRAQMTEIQAIQTVLDWHKQKQNHRTYEYDDPIFNLSTWLYKLDDTFSERCRTVENGIEYKFRDFNKLMGDYRMLYTPLQFVTQLRLKCYRNAKGNIIHQQDRIDKHLNIFDEQFPQYGHICSLVEITKKLLDQLTDRFLEPLPIKETEEA
jgi:hypothetical protein